MIRRSYQKQSLRRKEGAGNYKFGDKIRDNTKIDDFVHNKDILEKKLQEINDNIEVIGQICDRKKQRSYEEYSSVLKSNKALIEEELSKVRFKLVDALKNSTREDLLKKLQKDFSNKKNQVYDTDKDIQNQNKILYSYEHKLNKLKEEKRFLNQELKMSNESNLYLKAKFQELEEAQKNKYSDLNIINIDTNEQQVINTKSQVIGDANTSIEIANQKENDIKKLQNYFAKHELMLQNKLLFEEKAQKDKQFKYKSLMNFKNQIQAVMRNKIKEHQQNQIMKNSDKISNQEVFFNGKANSKMKLSSSNIYSVRSRVSELGLKDKREIVKMFLDNEEIKHYIFTILYG